MTFIAIILIFFITPKKIELIKFFIKKQLTGMLFPLHLLVNSIFTQKRIYILKNEEMIT